MARFDHGYSPGFERAFNSARSTSGWVEALILVVLSATTLICAGRGGKAEQLERLGPARRLLLPLPSRPPMARAWATRRRRRYRRFQRRDRRTETPALTRRRARATASGAMHPQFRFRAPRGLSAATVHALHVATSAPPARRTDWRRPKLEALPGTFKAASSRAVTTEPRPPLPLQA